MCFSLNGTILLRPLLNDLHHFIITINTLALMILKMYCCIFCSHTVQSAMYDIIAAPFQQNATITNYLYCSTSITKDSQQDKQKYILTAIVLS